MQLSHKDLNYLLYCTRTTLKRSDSLLTDEDKAYIEEVLAPKIYDELDNIFFSGEIVQIERAATEE